jgi:hypothetical protein
LLFPYGVGGLTMRARVLRFVGVSLATLCWASPAITAEPETRIVEAAARQDMATVRVLLKQRGVNVNAADPFQAPGAHLSVRPTRGVPVTLGSRYAIGE